MRVQFFKKPQSLSSLRGKSLEDWTSSVQGALNTVSTDLSAAASDVSKVSGDVGKLNPNATTPTAESSSKTPILIGVGVLGVAGLAWAAYKGMKHHRPREPVSAESLLEAYRRGEDDAEHCERRRHRKKLKGVDEDRNELVEHLDEFFEDDHLKAIPHLFRPVIDDAWDDPELRNPAVKKAVLKGEIEEADYQDIREQILYASAGQVKDYYAFYMKAIEE